ncbi:MAG: cation:proton antiporter [Bacteroidaceae bacterium]|nr:cation:proton antiporter [Bacteroidaceae bacterium]MEA5100022.1 cation:proton antiporter [Bacteroidales bacterium]
MKKYKGTFFYLIITSLFTALIFYIIYIGKDLEAGREIIRNISKNTPFQDFSNFISNNLKHSVGLLILQIIAIIIVARGIGFFFKKMGQPVVIGEILAGIVLGPSLLGTYFPEFSNFLFAKESLEGLQILSQVGLVLFMFVIGMELNLKVLKNTAYEATVISHASIIIPFALGIGLAYYLYPSFAPTNIPFSSFSLFIGISMSITAFPVLARIVQEKGLHKTKIGALSLICAAINDITAWCLLAVIIAVVKAGSFASSIYTIVFAIAYVFLMISVVRPFLKKIVSSSKSDISLNKTLVVIVFLVLLISSFITETIGIHALFGAFMAGTIMPENIRFRKLFIEKIEDVALVLFLPIFFVISGLKTEIGLIDNSNLWQLTGIIIAVAIAGKFIGSAAAAKFVGQSWKDSLTLGTLMNTRGLMEIVVLNIGYDLGVLNAEIFVMLILMALITTFMTGLSLSGIEKIFKTSKIDIKDLEFSKDKILLFFRNAQTSTSLVRIANSLTKKTNAQSPITAIHIAPSNGLSQMNTEQIEKESFKPIVNAANNLDRKLISFFKVSNNFQTEVVEFANQGNYDFLLMDSEESIFYGTLLGRVLGFTTKIINPEKLLNTVRGREPLLETSIIDLNTRAIEKKTKMPVGILLDKEIKKFDNILFIYFDKEDVYLNKYSKKFIDNEYSSITILDYIPNDKSSIKQSLSTYEDNYLDNINIITYKDISENLIASQDLIIVSFKNFNKLFQLKKDWLNSIPSVLIISI